MRTDSVIELSHYREYSVPAQLPSVPVHDGLWRVRRRCLRILTVIEAAVSVCIGIGFLTCLWLVIRML